MKRIVAIVLLCSAACSTLLFAQKTANVCGEYIYYAPENVSKEQAKQTALTRARLQALADEFGLTVMQHNTIITKDVHEKADITFFSLGGTEVKGEWIADTQAPDYKITYEQEMLVVKASVCGKAREIVGAGVDFTATVSNTTTNNADRNTFHDGDDLYLHFHSPANGYLAVYLIDDTPTAFCLLPYPESATGQAPVKANTNYVFFSPQEAPHNERATVKEYFLRTGKDAEPNLIYVIFSPNPFTKANDNKAQDGEVTLPRELSYEAFQQWLTKNRGQDKDLKVVVKTITIKN